MHAKWEVVGLLERNATMVENWLAEAVPMAEGLYRLWRAAGNDMEALPNLQMEGQFTGECRWCEFRKGVCEVVEQMLLVLVVTGLKVELALVAVVVVLVLLVVLVDVVVMV